MHCEIYDDSDLWFEKTKTQEAPHKGSLAASNSACRCSVQISLHFENETEAGLNN